MSQLDLSNVSLDIAISSVIPAIFSSFATVVASEQIKNSVNSLNIMFDRFGNESVDPLTSALTDSIKKAFVSMHYKDTVAYENMLKIIIESIPEPYHDQFLAIIINKLIDETDCRLRIQAAKMIKFMNSGELVKDSFLKIVRDRIQSVKIAAISALNSEFRNNLDEKEAIDIINNAINDPSTQVRNAAVKIIPLYANVFVDKFKQLLKNPRTMQTAIEVIPKMIQVNGLDPYFECLNYATSFFPEDVDNVLLEIAKYTKDSEKDSLLELFKNVESQTFKCISKVYEFSQYFEDKKIFFEMINPALEKQWRNRLILLNQAILYANDFNTLNEKKRILIDYAYFYTKDPIAYIRNESIRLIIIILKNDPSYFKEFADTLINSENWQQRLLLAKIISHCNNFNDETVLFYIKRLANDKVSNIQDSIANTLKGTTLGSQIFSENSSISN